MSRNLRKIASLLLAAILVTAITTACDATGAAGRETVIIYTHDYEEVVESFMNFLQGEFPDVEFIIATMAGGNLDAKVQVEGRDTEIDIVHSSSSGANALHAMGLLHAFEFGGEFLPEFNCPDSMIAPNGVWCGAILVNTVELERLGLDEPKSYMDLLDPQYRGHIVMSNPASSSTGRFFLIGILNLLGDEEGWKFFEELDKNIFQYTETGGGPASMVNMGEAAIGLGIDYQGQDLVQEGRPIKVLFAQEGAPFDNDTIVVIDKVGGVRQIVLDVARAMTSSAGNAVFNNYSKSVMVGVADRNEYPDSFRVLDMTGITDMDRRAAVLEIWSEKFD